MLYIGWLRRRTKNRCLFLLVGKVERHIYRDREVKKTPLSRYITHVAKTFGV